VTHPLIQLVDAPTATANVLFDFNDVGANPKREVASDEFKIGTPELEGDIDAVDPLYGVRMVSFTCAMTGTKPVVAATLSTLARRLLTPGQGWLRVQITPTSRLLFFRTYRPQPEDLSFDQVQTTSSTQVERWELGVNIPCEPFAYGERVTFASQLVSSDPTASTNPLRLVLPAIQGDAPAQLDVSISTTVAFGGRNAITVMAHAGATAPSTVHVPIGTGDGGSPATDTSAPVTGSAYAGGSCREVSFATDSGYVPRLTEPIGAGLAPGRYRVFLRASTNVAASTVTFRVGITGLAGQPRTPAVFTPESGTKPTWIDLGVFSTNPNIPTSPNIPMPIPPTILNIWASRSSGTGVLQLDHLMLVPVEIQDSVESRSMRLTSVADMNAGTVYVDGTYNEVISPSWGGGNEVAGAFVRATPGVENVLNFTLATAPFATDVLTRTATVTAAYHPLFLYVGDS
jgi:hypothetical protein